MRKVRRLLKENWIPIVVGILLTKWAVDYAYRVRGYDAIGSEWLVLPFTIFIFNWGKAAWEDLRGENNEPLNSIAEKEKNEARPGNESTAVSEGESIYTINEFAKAAATAFERPYSPDIVRAAFLLAGAKEATKKEASVIIKKFLGEEVKE